MEVLGLTPNKARFNENKRPLHVFFSYSSRDQDIVRPAIHQASEILKFHPIISSELVSVGEPIVGKIRRMINLSELVIIVFSKKTVSLGVVYEFEMAAYQGKPLLVFAERGTHVGVFVTSRFEVKYFEDSSHLAQLMVQSLQKIQHQIEPTLSDEKIRQWSSKIMQLIIDSNKHSILILGKDSDKEGQEKIRRIKKIVTNKGYYPLILKELPEVEHVSIERKMLILGALARFVLAEDSRPSGHIDEVKICAINEFVTATLREAGTGSTWMQVHYPIIYSFMQRFCYSDSARHKKDKLCDLIHRSLEEAVNAAIRWAEDRVSDQERAFKDLYKGLA